VHGRSEFGGWSFCPAKNDPKGIHGVSGIDGRLIDKNTNNWEDIDGVPGVDGRSMSSSQESLAAGCRQTRAT